MVGEFVVQGEEFASAPRSGPVPDSGRGPGSVDPIAGAVAVPIREDVELWLLLIEVEEEYGSTG
jgi:hypothetical protein